MVMVFSTLIVAIGLALTISNRKDEYSYLEFKLDFILLLIGFPPLVLISLGTFYCDLISDIFVLMSHIVSFMTIVFTVLYFDLTYYYDKKNFDRFKLTLLAVLVMTFMMDILFFTNNLLLIFFLSELSLLPLGFLMMKDSTIFWRAFNEFFYENKRPFAFYYLIFFTIVSGGIGLLGIILIYFSFGTLNFYYLNVFSEHWFKYQEYSYIATFTFFTLLLWIAIKVPMSPVHIWLPKAHVEGSTESSMLLAGIILKITTYVLIRLSQIPFFVPLFDTYRPFLLSIAVTTALSGAFGSLLTTDMKRITAYSSVSHMGIILSAGFFLTASSIALPSYIILLMTHTVISTAMFMMIGCIYKTRLSFFVSRNRLAYGGLCNILPVFFLFGAIIFANLNIPLTMGFMGELGILITVIKSGLGLGIILCLASFILLLPMLSMLGQVIMGPIRLVDYFSFTNSNYINVFHKKLVFNKFSWSETFLDFYNSKRIYFSSIFLVIFIFGLYPFLFIDYLEDIIISFIK
jgi:NADH-quinone oxidoreductase subunit M